MIDRVLHYAMLYRGFLPLGRADTERNPRVAEQRIVVRKHR